MNIHLGIAIGLAAVSLGLVIIGGLSILECIDTRSWPSVEATVVTSTVESEGFDPISYSVKIGYRYSVGSHSLIGHRIFAGGKTSFAWAWLARRTAKKYAAGSIVRAYYAPHNPKVAVLKPGLNGAPFAAFGMALFLMFCAWNQFALSLM